MKQTTSHTHTMMMMMMMLSTGLADCYIKLTPYNQKCWWHVLCGKKLD